MRRQAKLLASSATAVVRRAAIACVRRAAAACALDRAVDAFFGRTGGRAPALAALRQAIADGAAVAVATPAPDASLGRALQRARLVRDGILGASRLPPGPSEAVARHSTRSSGGEGSGGRRPSRLPRGRPPPPPRGRLLILGRPLPALPAAAAAAAAACSSDFQAAQAGAPARRRLLVLSARPPAAAARGALPG